MRKASSADVVVFISSRSTSSNSPGMSASSGDAKALPEDVAPVLGSRPYQVGSFADFVYVGGGGRGRFLVRVSNCDRRIVDPVLVVHVRARALQQRRDHGGVIPV